MPKREDETIINVEYEGQSPSCSCDECVKRRLKKENGNIDKISTDGEYPNKLSKIAALLVTIIASVAVIIGILFILYYLGILK
jgi:hypothetical protein